jgi:signal transduction histidine kinase/PAS domain-containing protein
MALDTDAEILGLRAVLRDLVALSTIPAAWVGREPPAVAAGLADVLIGLLQLDFASVRLCDPSGAGAVDVTRGNAWETFPDWLDRHLDESGQLLSREIVPDVGGGAESSRGVVIPVGVNGEGGLVAAASDRPDFPTDVDQLLLSLAANHAATAFQGARLVHERRRAEEALRKVRDELELTVTERTAELRRSEAYLAEAQRLTQTGSFAIDVSTRGVIHSSAELSRLYGFDSEHGIPAPSEFLQRVHPQDRAGCTEALGAAIRDASSNEVEYRVVLPHRPVRRHRAIAHPVFDASGELSEVVGTIVDVTERRRAEAELQQLANEQAALRRVATLVAREASQAQVFTAIAKECGQLFGTEEIGVLRYEDNSRQVVLASSGAFQEVFPVGSRQPLGGENAVSRVFRTGRPARIEDYGRASGAIGEAVRPSHIRCVVATPILVEGRLWGAMVTGTTQDEPLPPETEARLGQFTELMATAIANTESRAEVERSRAEVKRLAEEQAALRRVATLVAEGALPTAVFDAVAAEVEGLLEPNGVTLSRYEPGAEVTVVAHRGSNARRLPPGARVSHEGENVTTMVRRSERPARMEHYEGTHGAIAELVSTLGVRVAVGAPIVVDGRLWGVIMANWTGEESPPPATEERMAQFAQLLDTAIANADTRDQLTASRARLLTASDDARRRVVRDLHDGAQQRLVHTIVTLKLAQRALREGHEKAESLVGEALEQAEQGNAELRELAHGILPAALTRGGLRAGVNAIVTRLDLPVRVDVPAERFSAEIEASAYFMVAEALTNVIKHAKAGRAEVRASVQDAALHVEVRDDGIGGAGPDGHGLVGMGDRVTALGGWLKIESPAGGGTLLAATLPLPAK